MANRHMKRCSMALITKEIQIKTTTRYRLRPVRMAIINKTTSSGMDVRGETFGTFSGNADWGSPCGKQCGETSKNEK